MKNISIENLNNNEDILGYRYYGVNYEGFLIFNSRKQIEDMVNSGQLTKKQGELEIEFLESQNDMEKDNIYKKIIDNSKEEYNLSDLEIEQLKNQGYKKHYETLDRITFQQLVNAGYMTEEELEMEINFLSATNEEEREKAYISIVDNLERKEYINKKHACKFKKDGYKAHYDNMDRVRYCHMIWEMYENGYINMETAVDLENINGNIWSEKFNNIYERYLID